jgi:Flp pilus assembly protein TadG
MPDDDLMLRNLAILFLAATAAMAQSDRSTLTGLVTDKTGAVIVGASVEAVNQSTGLKYATTSNAVGIYALPQLPVGLYSVNIKAEYFVPDAERVQIHVAETVTLDVTLQVREVDGTIDVTAVAPVVDTTTSENSTGITEKLVTDLPLSVSGNMRNPESFIFLTPGVTGTASNTQIDGSQSRAKEVIFDGVGATSPESGGTLFTYPSVEAVSEFRLVNSDFSAEYGRTGGGFEVFSSKSGFRLPAQ